MNINNIEKKIGQLMVVGFDGKELNDDIKYMIHKYHVGSIILFGRNVGTPQELLELTTDLQHEAKKANYTHPLLICLDQENGVVRRLGVGTTKLPGAMLLGATDNVENAFEVGRITGNELRALGINWNLSPSVDINSNPANPVIGVRSFGDIAGKVSLFGLKVMKGMQEENVAITLKHFPGHGDTESDSHFNVPIINKDLEQLRENELIPFDFCIQNNADAVLVAHVALPPLTDHEVIPASISKVIVTDILRGELKFEGIITTDCMEMAAISNGIGTEKAAVKALKAGIDLVMVSHTRGVQEASIKEIVRAFERGEITLSRIEESIVRVNKLKETYTNWDNFDFERPIKVPIQVGSIKHEQVAREIYRQGITVVRDSNIIPIPQSKKILVLSPKSGGKMEVEDKESDSYDLGNIFKKNLPTVDSLEITNDISGDVEEYIINKSKNYDVVVIGTISLNKGSKQIDLIKSMLKENIQVIVIGMRNPYDSTFLPEEVACINTYEFTDAALDIATKLILGTVSVEGTLPVRIQ